MEAKRLILELPGYKHSQIKAAAAKRGLTMKSYVLGAIQLLEGLSKLPEKSDGTSDRTYVELFAEEGMRIPKEAETDG